MPHHGDFWLVPLEQTRRSAKLGLGASDFRIWGLGLGVWETGPLHPGTELSRVDSANRRRSTRAVLSWLPQALLSPQPLLGCGAFSLGMSSMFRGIRTG